MNVEYLVAFILCGGAAFLAARVVRQWDWDTEAIRRSHAVARVDGSADRYAESDALLNVRPGTDANSDGNGDRNGAGFYLAEYRSAGRRAIQRIDGGPRPGRHVADGDPHLPDAPALK